MGALCSCIAQKIGIWSVTVAGTQTIGYQLSMDRIGIRPTGCRYLSRREGMMNLVDRAKDLAYRAHAGQVDKAGRAYIDHVARVAERVREDRRCPNEDCNGQGEIIHWETTHCGDPSCCSPATSPCPACDEAEAVAWLHDVLEDCPDYANEFWSLPGHLTRQVHFLTRIPGAWPDKDYYARIQRNPVALRVKLADITDNSDEARLALLDERTAARLRRKYAKAVRMLTGGSDG